MILFTQKSKDNGKFLGFCAGKKILENDTLTKEEMADEISKEVEIHKKLSDGLTRDVIPVFIETL